jgi:twitching motility two-component system response regulator PilH
MFQRHAVAKVLRDSGHRVLEAENGYTGLERAELEKPDCIILDLIMPALNGFDTLRTLREKGIGIPVVVFTADIQVTSRQRCMALGASAFLNKPLNRDELKEVVRKLLGDERKGPSDADQSVPS